MEIGLTRGLPYLQVRHERLCGPDRAYLPDRARRPLDLCHEPVAGCLPHAPQRELAAEYSLDFRL